MTQAPERQAIIGAWENLQATISDFERGRASEREMKFAHFTYLEACNRAGEAGFALRDIASDDMAAIPIGYPESPDVPFDRHGQVYNTPYVQGRSAHIKRITQALSDHWESHS